MNNNFLPKAKAITLSNKPVFIAVLVFALLLIILIYSMSTANSRRSEYGYLLDDTQIESGEFWLVDGAGLAMNRDRKQPTTGVIGSSGNNALFPASSENASSNKSYFRDEQGTIRVAEIDEQGREFIRNADGSRSYVQVDEQGRKFISNADGTVTYLDEQKLEEFVRNADGTISYVGVNEQGQEFIRNPNGTTSLIQVDEQGRKYVTNPDGSISFVESGTHERAKVINPDGTTSYITKGEDSTIIENPDGTVTHIIKNEDGTENVLITGVPKTSTPQTEIKLEQEELLLGEQPLMQLTPEELANIRAQKLQNYLTALSSPVLAKKESQEENTAVAQAQYGVGSNFDALNALAGIDTSGTSSTYDPSADKDKEAFFERSKQDGSWTSNSTRIEGFDYELKTGTVITGVMTTEINSDLPGNMIAQVSQNIYDSATGKYVLIPQGSKLFGVFDSRVVYGQERVLVAWNRIIFPDGSAMTLPAMPGTDKMGNSGFHDLVNNHYFRTFGSAALMSLIVGGTAYATDMATGGEANEDSLMAQMTASLAQQLGQTSATLLEKNLNIKPTLEIRAGYKFNIILTQDLVFEAPYQAWR